MTCLQRIASKSNPVPCFQAKWLLLRPLLFPQMVKLCWAHGLYDAIFYVYNRGMRDYTTPLEVFLDVHYLSPGGWGSEDFGYVTIKVTWSSLRLCGIWMILLSGSQFSIVPCLYSETTDFPPPPFLLKTKWSPFPPSPFRLIKLCLVPWDIWPSVNRVKFH